MRTPTHNSSRGFTLIEFLIVIAVTLILLTGECATSRLLQRSTRMARENDRASAILSDQLAQLKSRDLSSDLKTITLTPPLESGPMGLEAASGEISFATHPAPNLVEVKATLRWKSMVGRRDLVLTTLMRTTQEGQR